MPEIFYGRSAYNRTRGNLPELPLVNLFAEATPIDTTGIALQSRRGLVEESVVGSGPIRGAFQRDGALSGVRFAVSGTEVYAGATLLGTILGDGPVSFAATETEMLISAGGPLYRTDGVTLAAVVFPDGANVTAVKFLAGRFVAIKAGTQRFHWSAVLDGTSWDALDYASAENEPDRLLDLLVVDDSLVPLGSEGVEFWPRTGNADLPFSPTQQRVFEQGIIDTGCAVASDNSFFWIGNDGIVYRNGDVPQAIADDGIVERSKASATHSMFLIEDERHKFVCCRFDTSTMVYDITTQQWCEFASFNLTNFRGRCAIAGPIIGDDATGTMWSLAGYLDAEGPMERRLRGGVPLSGGSFSMDNVRVTANTGQTPHVEGDYTDPTIEMRFSTDYGQTWSDWDAESLGTQGSYRTLPEWRALGMGDAPGVLFEWRVSDPVDLRFSGALLNESGGGRSR